MTRPPAKREAWWLPIAYFDGLCEALRKFDRCGRESEEPARCEHTATSARDGHAVCAFHKVQALSGFDTRAAVFRFGKPVTDGARVRALWEF